MVRRKAAIVVGLFAVLGCGFAGIVFAGGSKGSPPAIDEIFAAGSKGPPPSIDDILGSWTMSGKRMAYHIGTPGPVKTTGTDDFTITKTSSTEVYLSYGRRAHYINGLLIVGAGDDMHDPPDEVVTMYYEISGKPGRLVMKGKEYFYTWTYGEVGRWHYKGKQLPQTLAPMPSMGSVVAEASTAPPTIDDLNGTVWTMKIASAVWDLSTGEKMPLNETLPWTIDKIDATTVTIHIGGAGAQDLKAYYDRGVLFTGVVDDATLATESFLGYFLVSGSPGKLAMKGEFMTYDVALDETLEAGKVSGKQENIP